MSIARQSGRVWYGRCALMVLKTLHIEPASGYGTTRRIEQVSGLAIASIGLYGIVAYSALQRTPEFGRRVALGAGTRHVLSLVLREAVAIAAIGAVIGLPVAYATSRAFAALFGIQPTDLFTWRKRHRLRAGARDADVVTL
jgi:hypothetical protein